ncbi:MAG TPA: apolipoprotein N-acyltransferase [Paracoccaceae bacterium]|nr:apolipoprotein N-acyltransferase [Paracoccaceae bacterium]
MLTLLVARARGARAAAAAGLWAGAGHFGLALSWIVEPFLIDAPRHGWMAPFALVLMAFGLGLFWAGAAALAALARGGAARALAFAATLTGAEALRGVAFTGFPWAQPGHAFIDTPVAQVAALAGPLALTLLAVTAAALPVAARLAGTAVSAAILATAWGWGAVRLALPDPPPPDPAPVLRLVQPNAEQAAKWDPDLARRHFDTLLALTEPPVAGLAPDLVIWPETALPYTIDRVPQAVAEIAEAAGGAPVAAGVQRTDGGLRAWNSLAVIGPGGTVGPVYDKHHLVPFGEYIPFGDLMADWFGLRAFAAQDGAGYSAGPGPTLLDLGPQLGTALPLICYEAVFPAIPRRAGARPGWIVQVTNDAWFGTLTGPYQHLAQSRLRAVEQGLPLVRVANTGVSAVIDARGRMLQSLPLGQRGVIDAPLPGALPATPYARRGGWPAALAVAFLLAAAALVQRRA